MELPLTFDAPWWLLLLPPALAYLVWCHRTTFAPLPPWRSAATLGLRLLALILLVAAVADARYVREARRLAVIFAVDASDSLGQRGRQRALEIVDGALRGMGPDDRAGVVAFAGEAYVDRAAAPRPQRLERLATSLEGRTQQTDIAAALRQALSSLPDDAHGRVVLLSDGNATTGDARAQAIIMRSRQVDLIAIPVDAGLEEEVLVEGLDLPPVVRKNEPFALRVRIRAYRAGSGTLDVYRDDKLIHSRTVRYGPGAQTVRVDQTLESEAFTRYEVVLRGVESSDTIAANNRARGVVRVRARSRVLLLEGARVGSGGRDRARFLAKALREGGIEVDVRGAAGLPTTREALGRYDALILSDVEAPRSRAAQERIRDYVKLAGGGLLMLGGRDSYAMGGYYSTPVEEALPLSMDVRKTRVIASLAIAIVIDRSGSMAAPVSSPSGGSRTKISLACEGAIATLRLLRPNDEFGALFVDTVVKHRLPRTGIGRIGGDAERQQLIAALRRQQSGGGGIYAYTGLAEAYARLRKRRALVKHILLFSDGDDTEKPEGCRALAREQFRRHKITLSTISLGDGKDTAFLDKLARSGGGEFYLVKDANRLPRVFAKDTMLISRAALVEEPIVPRRVGSASLLDNVDWRQCPPLLGYNLATPKPRAEVLLEAVRELDLDDGTTETEVDPILARWRYGLGKAVCFTSDAKNRWGARWIGWDGYKQFWIQTVRWAMRGAAHEAYRKRVEIRGGRGTVTVDARDDDGRIYPGLDLRAIVQPPKGEPRLLRLRETGPGQYEASFPVTEDGAYFAAIHTHGDGSGSGSADGASGRLVGVVGGVRGYADEYRRLEPDAFALQGLARLAGGRLATTANGVFEPPDNPRRDSQPIWHLLLAAALLMLFGDILTRRLVLPDRVARATESAVASARERLVAAREALRPKRPTALRPTRDVQITVAGDPPAESDLPAAATPTTDEPGEDLAAGLLAAKRRARARREDQPDD